MSDPTNDNSGQGDQPNTDVKPLFTIGTRDYDVDAAVSKITNADNHISTLEQERKADKARLEELERELEKRQDLEAKLDQALARVGDNSGGSGETDSTNPVDIQELRNQVIQEAVRAASETTNSIKQQEIEQQNTLQNIELAKAKFGSDYEAKLRAEASKLGMTDTDIQKLAKGGTETFKRLFDLNTTPASTEAGPNSSVRGSVFTRPVNKDLPDPTKAFRAEDRVRLMQERLEQKAKEKGLI